MIIQMVPKDSKFHHFTFLDQDQTFFFFIIKKDNDILIDQASFTNVQMIKENVYLQRPRSPHSLHSDKTGS
jgi:hypothetical protein